MLANEDWHAANVGEAGGTLFIGALKEKEKKEKDNQYKLKRPMAIAIGLNTVGLTKSLYTTFI